MASRWLSDDDETWMKFHETAALPPEREELTVRPRLELPPPQGDSQVELHIETPRLPSDRPPEPGVETPRPRDDRDRDTHVGLVARRKRPLAVATAVCALGAPVLAHVAVSRMIRDRAASGPTSATHETQPAPALDAPFSPTVDESIPVASTVVPSEVATRAAAAATRSKAHSPRSKRGTRAGSH